MKQFCMMHLKSKCFLQCALSKHISDWFFADQTTDIQHYRSHAFITDIN